MARALDEQAVQEMTPQRAKKILGLRAWVSAQTALKEWKAQTVAATLAGQEDRLKLLSQVKQALKKPKYCQDCRVRIGQGLRCSIHARLHRFRSMNLAVGEQDWQALARANRRAAAKARRTGHARAWGLNLGLIHLVDEQVMRSYQFHGD